MAQKMEQDWWDNQEPTNAKEIRREVWWAFPPQAGQTDEDIQWGHLIWYDNDDVRFLDERPTDEEIKNRNSCHLFADKEIYTV